MTRKSHTTQVSPFTVVIDTREQRPWSFADITIAHRNRQVPIEIPVVRQGLATGDYSIQGREDVLSIERKSIDDLLKTLTRCRKRFERELTRMQKLTYSAVVVEAEWAEVMDECRQRGKPSPQSIDSTILSFTDKYPATHWFFRPGRWSAAKTAYKIMQMVDRHHPEES